MTGCGLNTSVIGEDLPQYFRAKGGADIADHDEQPPGFHGSTVLHAAGKREAYAQANRLRCN
jgi:hypothetical protein